MRTGTEARIAFLICDNQTSSRFLAYPPASRDFYKRASRQRLHQLSTKEAKPVVPCYVLYTRHLFHPGSLSSLCTSPCIKATRVTTWHAVALTDTPACERLAIANDYQLKPGRSPHMHKETHMYIPAHTEGEIETTDLCAAGQSRHNRENRQAGSSVYRGTGQLRKYAVHGYGAMFNVCHC